VVALRKWFLPILGVLWLGAYFLIPADNVFPLRRACACCLANRFEHYIFLKPKDYDAHDVEVSGLYWHFVDLVWMFISRWFIDVDQGLAARLTSAAKAADGRKA